MSSPQPDPRWRDRFRYGPICLLALTITLYSIAARDTAFSRGVIVGLSGTMLAIAAITSSQATIERRRWTGLAVAAGVLFTMLTAVDVFGPTVASAAAGGFAVATIVTTTGGLLRLLTTRGVTIQAVAGGLAIYALSGLAFAFAVDMASRAGGTPYFTNGTDGTLGEHVYYSITCITTTGFGDFTAARSGGRMLAALEMLFGQIYLVTVVALLISNVKRAKAS